MKYLILGLFLFTSNLRAENWLNQSKILASSKEAFSLQADCERVSQEKCYDLGEYPSSVYSLTSIEVDDYSKPIFLKNYEISCANEASCTAQLANTTCDPDYTKSMDLLALKVSCQKLNGYLKKSVDNIELDSAKLSSYQQAQALKTQSDALEANINLVIGKINCGKRAIAILVLRNVAKNLTPAQISSMNASYAPIEGLLSTASLATAKLAIQAISADGVIITEGDKTAVIAEIDKCL